MKWFESYGTMGGLFTELTGKIAEISVATRMWGLIVEVINFIERFFSCDQFELIEQIKAVKEAFDRLEIAGNMS